MGSPGLKQSQWLEVSDDFQYLCFGADVSEYGLDPLYGIVNGGRIAIEGRQSASGKAIDDSVEVMLLAIAMDEPNLAGFGSLLRQLVDNSRVFHGISEGLRVSVRDHLSLARKKASE
jgi:hypothetical protein